MASNLPAGSCCTIEQSDTKCSVAAAGYTMPQAAAWQSRGPPDVELAVAYSERVDTVDRVGTEPPGTKSSVVGCTKQPAAVADYTMPQAVVCFDIVDRVGTEPTDTKCSVAVDYTTSPAVVWQDRGPFDIGCLAMEQPDIEYSIAEPTCLATEPPHRARLAMHMEYIENFPERIHLTEGYSSTNRDSWQTYREYIDTVPKRLNRQRRGSAWRRASKGHSSVLSWNRFGGHVDS